MSDDPFMDAVDKHRAHIVDRLKKDSDAEKIRHLVNLYGVLSAKIDEQREEIKALKAMYASEKPKRKSSRRKESAHASL